MNPSVDRSPLLGSFLFEGVARPRAEEIAAAAAIHSFSQGEIIYSADRFRRAIGVLLQGRALVTNASGVLLNTLLPPACFGVAALFHPIDNYVSTITAGEETVIAFYSDRQLEQLFAKEPLIARNYIAFLSERIQFLNEKIGSFTAPTAQARLAYWLLHQPPVFTVPSFTGLADQLNLGRASLYRGLERLQARGCIEKNDSTILVKNAVLLRRIASLEEK